MAFLFRRGYFVWYGLQHFTRHGYETAAKSFDNSVMERQLQGRVCIVTGANAGLGFQTSQDLAARGAKVIMVCRNAEKGEEAVKQVQEKTNNQDVHLRVCDVSSVAAIKKFVAEFTASGLPLHVLVNNAGVMVHDAAAKSAEGYDVNFATNTLGAFALTLLLEEKLKQSAPSKVVFVSSGGMLTERLEINNLQNEDLKQYDGIMAYSRDKRRMVALAERFAKAWKDTGVGVYSMHPGWTETPGLLQAMPGFSNNMKSRFRDLQQGADTIVWLALQDQDKLEPGAFYLDRAPRPKHLPLGGTGYNDKDVDTLWDKLSSMVEAVVA